MHTRPKLSTPSPLPSFSDDVHEKHRLTHSKRGLRTWLTPAEIVTPPLPVLGRRRVRICLPSPALLQLAKRSLRTRRGILSLLAAVLLAFLTIFTLHRRFVTRSKAWPQVLVGPPPTLVYGRSDLRRIWLWEIASGHYPSSRPLPTALGFDSLPLNPGLAKPQARFDSVAQGATIGTGVNRNYYHANVSHRSFPPRPIPGSIIDLDIVQDYCQFSTRQYVRDCLEILRYGAGLNPGNSLRRGNTDLWKHIYVEGTEVDAHRQTTPIYNAPRDPELDSNAGLDFSRKAEREPPFVFRKPLGVTPHPLLEDPCDPDHPRVFHIFWAGPFTDKPYMAILSFLFTQNVGLEHAPGTPAPAGLCRPQIWIWINPGPAAAVANPRAVRDMYDTLAGNPWSMPFLHPRFEDVVKFKLWNTTEQLDAIPEIKDEWRKLESLFNAGGNVYHAPATTTLTSSTPLPSMSADEELSKAATNETLTEEVSEEEPKKKPGFYDRLGSNSEQEYDRMSVILSDMARFVLCHRFGGTYLDADTIFLRDWEELWGWKGAFAYRWSRLEKYNTAVLRLHKNSALGSWLFRTALKNDFDFHPMTVSNYAKEAHMEGLLLRLPDALFDSAWLNVEDYQTDRPAFPYFTEFRNLFQLPKETSAMPLAIGFDNFFRGAFSYHFHNFWWVAFDPARNWPDLGHRFVKAEAAGRAAVAPETTAAPPPPLTEYNETTKASKKENIPFGERLEDDARDLSWATVLKRTFEAYIRGERPNMYGDYIVWS